ncbi:hypothetical protein [Thiohalomonas denitrificans]|uniref:Curli production assembly/transport component CsgG n=1 Tax=Thiohalomonas denitrificans TaxID=415747 RepID=A0A1G5QW52_9GAMM|nr:hypothetical protein [Thiohalomonas denitrificans]SCZ65780.1 hypothetical protein SAMN03097708_02878 [Thiohalomonas denitrificans]
MKISRISSLFLAAVLAVTLSACAPMAITGSADVETTAFGPKKRFAVVSVSSLKTFSGEKGITQLFKSTDEIPGADTKPLLEAVKPKVIASLHADRNFVLVPEKNVLHSKAYQQIKEDERKLKMLFMSDEINVADNYKYLSEPKKYAQLATALNVDGVIGVSMGFSISSGKSGLSINGLSLGRKAYSPQATVTAIAYDRQGKVIWKDSTLKRAEPGDKKAIFLLDFSDVTDTNFTKLHPKAIEMGGNAIEILVSRLDDTLSGKGTSSIQSMK